MAGESEEQQEQDPKQGAGAEGEKPEAEDKPIHPAEFRKLQRQLSAIARERDALKANADKASSAQLSEVEKARKERDDFAAFKSKYERATAVLETDRDAILEELPQAARDAAAEAIEGLPVEDQLKQLRVFKALAKSSEPPAKPAPKGAPVARHPPAGGKPAPSAEEIKANPGLLGEMSKEERRAYLATHGLSFGGNKR